MLNAITQHQEMPSSQQKLAGLYQECRLALDKSGGVDGMWFEAAIKSVVSDINATVDYVCEYWPHGPISRDNVLSHCGFNT